MVNVKCDDKEWIRRRQMRIIQVRKQSNDIARRLRERVINEEHQRRLEEKNLLDTKLHIWKVNRLKTLEEMYRRAISEFGAGHKMAIEKPDPVHEMKEKQKEYLCKAKERGESALEQELREKQEAAKKKQIPIQRKKLTRKIEDLRSSLICSIPVTQPSAILRNIYAGKTFDPREFENYDYEEHVKKNSKEKEKTQGKEAQAVKSTSEECFGIAKISPGRFQRKTRKKTLNHIVPKSGVISESNKENTSKIEGPQCENNWVNLEAVENLTKEKEEAEKIIEERISNTNLKVTESGRREKNTKEKENVLKPESLTKRFAPIRQKPVIECHGVSVPHNCKLKDSIYVVQSPLNLSEPNAIELALREEEKLLLEKNEKRTRDNAAEERGNKALEKQKIIKNYNELLMKLEKLTTKEKLIKSYCHIPPAHIFFSDERRKEKSARKQRIMNSEFERIYYDVTGARPDSHLNTRLNLGPSNETKADSESGSIITKLDFSKLDSNLKTNTPASSSESKSQRKTESNRVRTPVEKISIKKTPSSFHFKRTKVIKGDSKALLEIDRILKKCQEIRRKSHSNVDSLPNRPGPECSEKIGDVIPETETISCKSTENESVELQFSESDTSSPCEGNRVSDINDLKSSPRKNLSPQEKAVLEDLAMGDMPRNFVRIRNNVAAWPVHEISRTKPRRSSESSSTSYRSLPPEIQPKRINSLLKLLVILKESEGKCAVADELIVDIETLLSSLLHEAEKSNLDLNEENCREFENNPRLNYYISKLLDMSRETVAELSLSSESDTSLPKIPTFCDDKQDRTVMREEKNCLKQINDNSRISKITRAKELEEIIKRWKIILEQSLKTCSLEEEFSQSDVFENAAECEKEEEIKSEEKYEDIAKICSDRMAVLSGVLANCMKKGYMRKPDEEYGEIKCERNEDIREPTYVVCPEDKKSSCPKKENNECPVSKSSRIKKLNYCNDDCCPFLKPLNDGNNVNCQKGGVHQSTDASLESLPNVMEELLKKKIITSPFRWCQGNVLSDYSPAGSCHSRKSIREEIKHANRVNKLPDKNEQECPKPRLNNCVFEPYKCKDSCKGSCSGSANNYARETKKIPKKAHPVPENAPVCLAEFPARKVARPWKWKGPIRHRDAVYGIFSPVPRYIRVRPGPKQKNIDPEMYPAHPDELFKKKTFASRYVWDERTRDYIVNPNEGAAPATYRPFWSPQVDVPKSPGIKFISVKKNPQGAPKRPRSSPVRGYERDSDRMDYTGTPVDPCKVLHFEEEPFEPGLNAMDFEESDNDVMEEWIRRDLASKLYDRDAGLGGSCAGSCDVHCNGGFDSFNNRPISSRPGRSGGFEYYERATNSSPDVRECERNPNRNPEFFPVGCGYEEEYEDGDDYDDSEKCSTHRGLKWARELLQNQNERNRF